MSGRPFPSIGIAQDSHQRHRAHHRNEVDRNRPARPEDVGVQVLDQVGEGHRNHRAVDGVHQKAQPCRAENKVTFHLILRIVLLRLIA